jgi:tetratricopeptide (TPR) repeat protein
MADQFVNFYTLLGIDQSATDDQIKAAVKDKRALWYSKQNNPDQDRKREAEDQMKRIRNAEKALLNPETRAEHDKQIAAYVPPAPQPQPSGAAADQRDWLAEAAKYLRDNQPEAAAYAAREATQLNGANPEAWVLRGRASLLLNQADSAVFECGEAVRLQPASAEYHGDLGSAYQFKRDYDRAIGSYRTAQQLAPNDRRFPLSIGSLYVLEDKPKEAIKVLEPLHASQPDDQVANYWLAYALGDESFYSWTPAGSDGSRLITTREQVTSTKQNIERALGLSFDDGELRAELNRFLGEANKAERSSFRFPGRKVARSGGAGGCLMLVVYVVAIGILFGLLSSYPAVGIVLLLLALFGFYKLAVRPRWKRNADDLRSLNAATGGRGINA